MFFIALVLFISTSVINMQKFTHGIYLLKIVTPSQMIEKKL
jgi:hypothetical protein